MKMINEHDSKTCTQGVGGGACMMCAFANTVEDQRSRAEWSLESEMRDFATQYGEEALVEKIDVFMTARGLY